MSDEPNSLMSAHDAGISNVAPPAELVHQSESEAETKRRESREAKTETAEERPTRTLADAEDSARDQARTTREKVQQVREELATALHCDTEDLRIPRALAAYSSDAILKAMESLEFTAADLQSPDAVEILQAALEQEELDNVAESLESEEEDQDEETDEETEETEKQEEEKKPEEKQEPVAPLPSSIAEMSPEQRQAFEQRISEVYQHSQQINQPAFTEAFSNALAGPLGVAPENMPQLYGRRSKSFRRQASVSLKQHCPPLSENT